MSLPAVGPVTAGVVDVSREYGEMAYNISLLFLCFSFRIKALLQKYVGPKFESFSVS